MMPEPRLNSDPRRRIRFAEAWVDRPNCHTTSGGVIYRGERAVPLLMLAPAAVVLLALSIVISLALE